jgi:PAS domain S-box-containing protein
VKRAGLLIRRYVFAACVVIAATLVRLALRPWLGDTTPYLLFFPAMMAASWYGGFGPGLFATLLSAAAALTWFIEPFRPLALDNVADDVALILFLAIGAFIAHLNELLRRSVIVGGQLAAIVESSDDAIIGKDLNGIITSWNRAAARLFGYTAAEAIGKSITIIIPTERLPEEEHLLSRIRLGRHVDPLETRRQRKDGTLVDVSITVSPIRSATGEIVGASKIARDIGDRLRIHRVQQQLLAQAREATDEALESRDRLQFLAEVGELLTSSLDYAATLDRAVHIALPRLGDYCTVIVRDEHGATHLVAWGHVVREKEAALRELANRLIASAPARNVSTFADEVMRTGKTLIVTHARLEQMMVSITDLEPDILHLSRALRPYAYVGAPLNARGRTVGVMAFGRTEQESHHDYSPADIALIEDFSRRVSLAIENARLFRKADELNRLKDEFLATVSHELRTPLSAILGWSRMLVSGQLDPDKAKRAMASVERNAQAQAKLVDDILDVARGMVGNVRLEMKTIDLSAVADRGVDAIAPAASAKKIHVQVSAPAPVSVVGDPNRLQQVVWNLVSNAVKFTPPGGHVRVAIGAVNDHAELEVTDTGVGISSAFLPYVFDRFRQADGSFTRPHGGLGLGLAIARHLVELHGGSVEAKSEGEGKGATFVVRLPLAS